MSYPPVLLPAPRHIHLQKGHCKLKPDLKILLDHRGPDLTDLGLLAQTLLRETAGLNWALSASPLLPPRDQGLRLAINSHLPGQEAYQLQIYTRVIELEASDLAGLFYGLMTLKQLFRQYPPDGLPCLLIRDWPDFRHRGLMLDISRDKVPTQATLFQIIDQMAELKLNQLQLYTEHTFAYTGHEIVWKNASALTGEEILHLDRYCRERFIELVPNQNSFGHLTRWLKHAPYRHLAEVPETGYEDPLQERQIQEPFSLCPLDPKALELVSGWYQELLPHFHSRQFNIGCDETFDLGQGRSKEACQKQGTGRVYLDFLSKLHALVSQEGSVPQFWGDIVLNHPALIPEIPRPAIALNWGYEADHPFESEAAAFAKAGIPFYVCPGTSSWNALAGRIENALKNLRNAAEQGLQHQAIGYLITDWGDNGHWQPWAVSLLPLAYGAGLAWQVHQNKAGDLCKASNLHLFRDPDGHLAQVAQDLGNTYLKPEILLSNQSLLFYLLQNPEEPLGSGKSEGLSLENLKLTKQWLDQLSNRQEKLQSQRHDGGLLLDEFRWVTQMLLHACRLALVRLQTGAETIPELPEDIRKSLAENWKSLAKDFQRLWLARNRSGGLSDSLVRMQKLLQLYETSATR
ncbi:glycoside hydrolase [bacterium (Candidatus Blackallbacteria) CG17_big_fil_post_rev_8_21_14_2_50_48_46]|uniref:Glycoside hydrolase n=1 Tax=bacterium (Candidatus Blackallbacteria) CG17_big_fil_post_rev_8_21_14_2_50_48_46 TaxID=2014261 RepID=A0A2M7G427_9BACT|nr:MAG: glycoside hydrolase [bacterium (Candidatus Blackallbacteria) CG18_big_fil_WC_8_21_14_2_50_49_26]PIW16603.1 MAG: glycoside hydrolase [bacterium (Candidatus Blackallbacteria) CG17_big_fil_post_rev_8_21_14_2_50_48_46]PIW46111.1 MAG: glycoside hydrolase [bacterium (Candidatus Blackallbacteria) CG13_big_fil_rev_8_21_14_2_50_49_14]